MEWIVWTTDETAPDYGVRWSGFDLADLAKLYGLRVVRAGERILAIYPPALEPELIAYTGALLADAREYLSSHMDKIPILTPPEAVVEITRIMRAHKGLKFCRGEDGSRWPIYPSTWTAGQRITLQALWFVAGDALDRDNFASLERVPSSKRSKAHDQEIQKNVNPSPRSGRRSNQGDTEADERK